MMEKLVQNPEWLLIVLAPFFVIMMVLEYWLGQRGNRLPSSAQYSLKELTCNFSLAGLHQLTDLVTGLFIAKLYLLVFGWRFFDIKMSLGMFLVLMVLQDFFYYWFHRASHRIRWMWAAHVVHHSSENMNFSTAFRQSLMYPLAGMWLFWMPLVIIGFDPKWVVFVVLLNLGLQFFVHTQWIRRLGPLEWVINTPSHHRVHHGVNAQYIDKNYAGILIIWDRMFGTFEPEVEEVRYGISKPVNSFNPITVTFAEWKDMLNDLSRKDLTLRAKIKMILSPPTDTH
ncbi:sterol desaturase family protein [Vibrio barjaei]|jgi:sterol desaturase/sphingolipid hydroxylase (fatty acid hydroxylase superfamily)|uniref:Sterol desaturase family protein n=1 Tax=Vibrio barjaei TaxID=1676683 RepID=A0ABW7IJ11_9VIBR|nr:sterol desaturase family protein [Vibrio barjaei]MCG9786607.1 sterol desaturase family protein [Vibrio mediterranei]MCY9873544.1 sterol desaturase family protein [Vibrio barjaei]OIN27776.1 sterol desaturase [Vibrio barjaei]